MDEIVLTAKLRSLTGKQVKQLRREGLLPAVLYGHTVAPIPVVMDYKETTRTLSTVSSSRLVTVEVEGKRHMTLVREKQRHPVSAQVLHVDFLIISETEKLRTSVSLRFEGDAPAVKDYSGVLVTGIEEVEVEAMPKDLPDHITVNLSLLKRIGDSLHVRDLVIPAGVTVLTDGDELAALISGQGAEKAEDAATAFEPEVIEKAKKEEEK